MHYDLLRLNMGRSDFFGPDAGSHMKEAKTLGLHAWCVCVCAHRHEANRRLLAGALLPTTTTSIAAAPLAQPRWELIFICASLLQKCQRRLLASGGGARGGRSGAHFPAPSPAPDDQTQTVPNGKFERTNNNHVCQPRLRTAPVCNQKSDSPHKQPKQKNKQPPQAAQI